MKPNPVDPRMRDYLRRNKLTRQPQARPDGLDEDKIRCIREVAEQHPRFTPAEVIAVIGHDLGCDDITTPMARYVLENDL